MASPELPNQKRSIAWKLALIARALRTKFDQRVEGLGLSGAKWRVIAVASRRPGATQREIAEILGVAEVTAGRLIDRLCEDGYLSRRANPADRRAYCVYPTKSTKPLLDQLAALATVSEDEAFAGLSEKDLAQLQSLLDAIARNVLDERTLSEAQAVFKLDD